MSKNVSRFCWLGWSLLVVSCASAEKSRRSQPNEPSGQHYGAASPRQKSAVPRPRRDASSWSKSCNKQGEAKPFLRPRHASFQACLKGLVLETFDHDLTHDVQVQKYLKRVREARKFQRRRCPNCRDPLNRISWIPGQ